MTNISKKLLPKSVEDRIEKKFVKSIISLKTFPSGEKFLSEFLSPTEQVMLSKRLMIIFLLSQNISQYKIKNLLKVSSSTVRQIAIRSEQGLYKDVSKFCKSRSNRKQLLFDLEIIVRAGMPEIGKGRWKWLDELYEK
ncbi:MAG: hypothetical protein ISR99_00200 [Parcubacteria group bacterium]|nr:hypothetical protein [Parcubacteria group bacterium]